MSNTLLSSPIESPATDIKFRENGSGVSLAEAIARDMLYEVVDGQILEKMMGAFELEIANLMNDFLGDFVRSRRLGRVLTEMVFRIDQAKDLQRRPDVAYVSAARWPVRKRAPKVAVWDMVPDLAIEVVSPSNSAAEMNNKIHEYFEAGVVQVWMIYPSRQEIYVYTSTKDVQVVQLGQDLDGGELIPGFRLPLASLFLDDPE